MSSIKVQDPVRLKRDISRHEDAHYAKQGDTGIVQAIWQGSYNGVGSPREYTRWNVQVQMVDGTIKTFRLTSVEKV
jgi:hypothetical protein